ncbi:MAG: hypothetical protein R3D71_01085 [Rickettsiales bacterium]
MRKYSLKFTIVALALFSAALPYSAHAKEIIDAKTEQKSTDSKNAGTAVNPFSKNQYDESDTKFSIWEHFYYVNKNTDEVKNFLQWLQNSQFLDRNPDNMTEFSTFIGSIFINNPDMVDGWMKSVVFTSNQRKTVKIALWLAKRNDIIDRLYKNDISQPEYLSHDTIEIIDIRIIKPADIDTMWGAFYATGNTDYIKRVVDLLDPKTKILGDENFDKVVRKVAKWSLSKNAMIHKKINEFLKEERKNRSKEVRKEINEIISVSTKESAKNSKKSSKK